MKQRQFLLEGFNCKLYSEKELVEFYEHIIEENCRDIIIWNKNFRKYSNNTVEEYSDGGLSEGEEIDEEELEELKIQKNEMNLPYRIIHRQTTK